MKGAISVSEARGKPGLRLVLLKGFPSPWSQAAKGIFDYKAIDWTPVHSLRDDPKGALLDWTGQNSYPAAMYQDEEPRSGWAEILLLAERLAPSPSLIPTDAERRATLFGYAHEICGEMGLGWCLRLQSIHAGLRAETPDPISLFLADKYGYREDSHPVAHTRVVEVLAALDALLARNGGEYLLGELTALDVYWATFCNLVSPLPPELLPMPEALRRMFTATDPATLAAVTPALLSLRDRVYEAHLTLPVDL